MNLINIAYRIASISKNRVESAIESEIARMIKLQSETLNAPGTKSHAPAHVKQMSEDSKNRVNDAYLNYLNEMLSRSKVQPWGKTLRVMDESSMKKIFLRLKDEALKLTPVNKVLNYQFEDFISGLEADQI